MYNVSFDHGSAAFKMQNPILNCNIKHKIPCFPSILNISLISLIHFIFMAIAMLAASNITNCFYICLFFSSLITFCIHYMSKKNFFGITEKITRTRPALQQHIQHAEEFKKYIFKINFIYVHDVMSETFFYIFSSAIMQLTL